MVGVSEILGDVSSGIDVIKKLAEAKGVIAPAPSKPTTPPPPVPPRTADRNAVFHAIVKRWCGVFQKELDIKGFHVDGIFGNFGHESNGFTQLQEVGPRAGRGGAGWEQATGPRRVQFENYLRANGYVRADGSPDISSEAGNAGFIIQELKTSEHASLIAVRSTKTRDDACRVFMQKNERPGVPALESRIHWAIKAEAARLEAEAEAKPKEIKPVPDTTPPTVTADTLANSLRNIEQLLQDFATREAVSHGVPSFIPPIVESIIDKLDLPGLIAREIEKLGFGPFLNSLAPAIASIISSIKIK